jgi:hypothetical protein
LNRYRTYFLVVMLSGCLNGWAQPVQTVTLATPFSFSLRPEAGSPPPVVGETLGGFEVIKVSSAANGFDLVLVAYDTGSFKIPGTGGDIAINVMAPPPASIKDYAPPKEPEFIRAEEVFPTWIPLLVTALVLVIAILIWLRNRKKRPTPVFALQTPGGMGLLQEVKEGWLAGKLSSLQLGEGLVNSLQAQFGIPVKKSTLQLVKEIRSHYPDASTPEVENVLQNTDAWRFGKQAASESDGKSAITSLEGLFHFTNQKKTHNN